MIAKIICLEAGIDRTYVGRVERDWKIQLLLSSVNWPKPREYLLLNCFGRLSRTTENQNHLKAGGGRAENR
jgi:hypothetical protein